VAEDQFPVLNVSDWTVAVNETVGSNRLREQLAGRQPVVPPVEAGGLGIPRPPGSHKPHRHRGEDCCVCLRGKRGISRKVKGSARAEPWPLLPGGKQISGAKAGDGRVHGGCPGSGDRYQTDVVFRSGQRADIAQEARIVCSIE
jgi:hypothetical protein